MTIVFVGVHYKEGRTALDPKTRSGKMIDRLCQQLLLIYPRLQFERENLFEGYSLPKGRFQKARETGTFETKINLMHPKPTLLVLLGDTVAENVRKYATGLKHDYIRLPHPAKPWGTSAQALYVTEGVKKIVSYLHKANLKTVAV